MQLNLLVITVVGFVLAGINVVFSVEAVDGLGVNGFAVEVRGVIEVGTVVVVTVGLLVEAVVG